jgi:hypothetical protein
VGLDVCVWIWRGVGGLCVCDVEGGVGGCVCGGGRAVVCCCVVGRGVKAYLNGYDAYNISCSG